MLSRSVMARSGLDFLSRLFPKALRKVWTGRYSLPVVSVLIAFLLRLSLDKWLGDQDPYITFIVAVAVTGLYAGVRAALLAAGLGAVIAYYCFVPPRYEWGFQGVGDAVGFGVYLLAAIAVVLLTQARNRAAADAEQSLRSQIEAERKLLDTETLFHHFMDHSSACTYLRDEEGRCVYANEVAKREFGIGDDVLTNTGVPTAFTSDLREQDQQVLQSGQAMEFVDRAVRSGDERYWLTSKFPFVDLSGRKFVGGISFEITERMQAAEVLRKAERLASAGQMAALLAHEINNPLAALTNLIFLLKGQQLASPAREFVAQASEALGRINHIAGVTLGFHAEKDTPAPVPVCQVIDEVVDMLISVESFKNIRVQRKFECDSTVIASPPRIRQLISNLLANAMESGAQTVRIRVRPGRDWRRGRTGIRITIADDGRGIRQELHQRLFEPFFSTKPQKGTGLGLWASKAIVLRNDGTIQLRSNADARKRGTCIRIFFPTIQPRGFDGKFQPGEQPRALRTGAA